MKCILSALIIFFSYSSYAKETPQIIFGDVKIFQIKEKLYCINCGSGEDKILIKGEVPTMFEGVGTGIQAYYNGDKSVLIYREDSGASCPSGDWYAIDIFNAKSSKIRLPSCSEIVDVNFSASKKQTTVRFIQFDKRSTTLTFK